jgi:hypothetical protein
MIYGIGTLIAALVLVLMLGLSSYGQNSKVRGGSVYSSSFRHVAAQTIAVEPQQSQASTFRAEVFHPPARTDFTSLDESLRTLARPKNIDIRHHALGAPETMALMNSLRVRMTLEQTMIVIQAPNGSLTWGGLEETLASINAKAAFPGDRMAEIIKPAQEGKDILLVFSRGKAAAGTQLVQSAADYAQMPANKTEMFIIDPDDPANKEIIERTTIPPDSLRDGRLLMLVGGQIKGQLTRAASVTDIQALKKTCSGKSGCC